MSDFETSICPLDKLLNSSRPLGSDTIKVEKESDGYRFHLAAEISEELISSSSSAVYPCIISGGYQETGYAVNIYANGYDSDPTGTGYLQVLDLAQADDVPAGTRVIGHQAALTITGDTE